MHVCIVTKCWKVVILKNAIEMEGDVWWKFWEKKIFLLNSLNIWKMHLKESITYDENLSEKKNFAQYEFG